MKRLFDILISIQIIVIIFPIIIISSILIFFEDFKYPFYHAVRVGKNFKSFHMLKLRTMKTDAYKSGVESTSNNDSRITWIGHYIRKFKIDELSQLYNVLKGNMSLVGPRPNTIRGVEQYTNDEKKLLSVNPGITDFSSIIFSDEGEILKNESDPDKAYDILIRPWKSKLGITYINNQSNLIDFKLIIYTFIALFSKKIVINLIIKDLKKFNAGEDLIRVCQRDQPLHKLIR